MFPFNQEFSSQRPNAAYVGIGSPACPSHIGEDAALEPLESKGLVRCVCVMGGMAWNTLWPTGICKMAFTILVYPCIVMLPCS